MAAEVHNLNVRQGFNAAKDDQSPYGHLTRMTVGRKQLQQNIEVPDFCALDAGAGKDSVEKVSKTVGILESIYYSGGYADPIQISFYTSYENRTILDLLRKRDMECTDVDFDIFCSRYDPVVGKYFKAMHTAEQLNKGEIKKVYNGASDSAELAIDVAQDATDIIQTPELFRVCIEISPKPTSQKFHLAVSESAKYVKPWGVKTATDVKA
ncbi:hypothetical protein [Marinibactrum halimedae]|uniref:Uncharacterized protein n=1 Tax=Marinibactrum halimedae TaxID=1444977 RepID=A0AA37WKV3_9GAMM|nr:hypothetical protein [Marinibactrum halimedae]MCD9458105.1 hypothetical protein [Marinibactrum halimedae]GLS25039.1 hypothetical protein GCM10007877_07530 [Marinibactrum halimedae]